MQQLPLSIFLITVLMVNALKYAYDAELIILRCALDAVLVYDKKVQVDRYHYSSAFYIKKNRPTGTSKCGLFI